MIEVRTATADEMILAFLQAEIDTPTDRAKGYAHCLSYIGADRGRLIDLGNLNDEQQNSDRRLLLGKVRGYGERGDYLFAGFPNDASWRLVTVTPDEIKRFKYVNHPSGGWLKVSGSSRLVADGVRCLGKRDTTERIEVRGRVINIADRLRRGDKFPSLIAVQLTGEADVVLVEGHTRATAYALTGLPEKIDVIVGTSPAMRDWYFF